MPIVDDAPWTERVDLVDESGPSTLLFWPDLATEASGLATAGILPDRRFDLPVRVTDVDDGVAGVLTIVTVPAPWHATRGMITSAFRDREGEYLAAEGLPKKDFLLTRGTERREVGGI